MTGQPLLKSNQTGKTFTLPWGTILEIALAAGIDTEPDPCSLPTAPPPNPMSKK